MSNIVDFKMDKQEFFLNYSDKSPYLSRGAVCPEFVTWRDVNRALYATPPAQPELKIHLNGVIPEADYVENHFIVGAPKRRLKDEAFYGLLQRGATLVLNRADERFLELKALCSEVAEFTNSETLANGYITFSNVGGFGLHWDTHDVMAVQLLGRKRWLIYEPTFLYPLAGQKSSDHKEKIPTEPIMDIVMEPGDLLYVPRGWWHNALPIGETFHVAVGIHGPTMMDYLKWLTSRVLQNLAPLRRSARVGLDRAAERNEAAEVLYAAMRDPKNFEIFYRESDRLMRFNAKTHLWQIEKFGREYSGPSSADNK